MSVQKLLGEADKLFEKGKFQEGVAKIKAAMQDEPLNQIVATKLANVLVQNREPLEAAKVYAGLAKRLSDASKNQVAIAIYKQALDLSPDDISLRLRFAQECEAVGKLGDAYLQGQIALNYYLRRKKFFDASNILPMMARAQPKDEKIKMAWVEVLQLCQAEQKLIHLLVALCGPPGLVSQEFPQGGDPVALSSPLYEAIKGLVPFFPRDPKVAYAVAWCAYRRGRTKEFYHFLRECLRREPDFCLAILLFARALAEDKRLDESLFVYRYYKERMTADKNSDMLTLNRLMESFVEKNGWIKFSEEAGDLLDTVGFVKVMTGVEQKIEDKQIEEEARAEAARNEASGDLDLPPAEIDIGGLPPADEGMEILTATGQSIQEASKQKRTTKSGPDDSMKIQAELIKATIEATVAGMGNSGSNQTQTVIQPVVLPAIQAAALSGAASGTGQTQQTMVQSLTEDGVKASPAAAATVVAPLAADSAKVAQPVAEVVPPVAASAAHQDKEEETTGEIEGLGKESVEFTSLIKREDLNAAGIGKESEEAEAPAPSTSIGTEDPGATQVAVAAPAAEKTIVAPMADEATRVAPAAPEPATPESAAQAAEAEQAHEGSADETEEKDPAPKRATFNPLDQANLPSVDEKSESLKLEEKDERTVMFSPMDVLDAAKVRQNRELDQVHTTMIAVDPTGLEAEAVKRKQEAKDAAGEAKELTGKIPEADKAKWKRLVVEGDRPVAFDPVEAVKAANDSRRPMEAPSKSAETPKGSASAEETAHASDGDATVVLRRPDKAEVSEQAQALAPGDARPLGGLQEDSETAPASALAVMPGPESPAFMPIPLAASENKPGAGEEKVDLGDDLLEGPTRILTQPTAADKTEHLLKEIRQDLKQKSNSHSNIDMLFRKADRYTAKRNYYLARKALRHAQALGAEEETVKERLREIRKLELPEGLYNTISSDQPKGKVDTSDLLDRLEQEFELSEEDSDQVRLSNIVGEQIETILRETDVRTILDFGVGLHEMGLFRDAEDLFIRVVEEHPDHAFDAYYLAAISKVSRRDYAGAASILKHLSSDSARTDQEKIQIYYALGETFEKMRQPDRSREFYQKVAELDANYRNIRSKLDG